MNSPWEHEKQPHHNDRKAGAWGRKLSRAGDADIADWNGGDDVMSAARAAHRGNAIMNAAQPDRSSHQEVRGDGREYRAGQDSEAPVARRTPTGWRVGDEEVPDLTSAMVLADLLASELPTQTMPAVGAAPPVPSAARGPRHRKTGAPDPEKLEQTVAQLEHALSARVRVEQAIGVLAERHRLRPRQAFELLRSAARSRGQRVFEIASEVVDSATNPLLRIPDELAKPPIARRRGRIARHGLGSS